MSDQPGGPNQGCAPEGVHYVCQRCTNCCRWPGFVRLAEGEADRIAAYLGMDVRDFIEQYTELMPHRLGLSLVSRPDHSCIMLEGRDCRINPVKPAQCAGFPNTWNFPGWRDVCEAIPVPADQAPS